MSAPLVGIPSYRLAPGRVSRWEAWAAAALPEQYLEAVRRAGGRPVVLTAPDPDPPEGLLERLDALVLAGGGDVDPARYGEATHSDVYGVDAVRDEFEIGLVRAAVRARVPALCICRGAQVANVAFGGTLVQHLPDAGRFAMHGAPLGEPVLHEVRLAEGSALRDAVGGAVVRGASHHHQGIDRLGEGLVPVGWTADGLVEAMERRDAWLLAVQWHPEETAGVDPAQAGLFEALVGRAATREARPGG